MDLSYTELEAREPPMPRHRHALLQSLTIIAALALSSSAAFADTWSGGNARAPYPMGTSALRLVSEEVTFEERQPSAAEKKKWKSESFYWSVTATYVIENTDKKQKVEAVLAIPDAHCDTFEFCQTLDSGPNTFQDVEVDIARKTKKSPRKALDKQKLTKDNPWKIEKGDVYALPITLAAGEQIEVTYHYKLGRSGAVDGEGFVDYVHTPTAPWKGKTERSRLTITLEERPWGVVFSKGLGFKSMKTSKKGDDTTITFEQRGLKRPRTASIILGSDAVVGMAGCPIGVRLHVELFYDPSSKKIDMEELERNLGKLSDDGLRKCRNMVYAAQGYTFKDKKLQDFFYQYANPTSLGAIDPDFWGHIDRIDEEDRASYEAVIFVPDEDYSTKRLQRHHNQWVKAIKALEKERAKKK